MGYLSEEIECVCMEQIIDYKKLNESESHDFHTFISSRLHIPRTGATYWERMNAGEAEFNPEGWKKISTLLVENPIYLFFDPRDERSVFEFYSTEQIVQVLSHSSGFVFYIFGSETENLVCFNDHNMLICLKIL
jgi:hypothetical protein